jgi:hypothetical protein
MERDTSRESYDSTEDDRDYDPKVSDPVLGAVSFDGQLARDPNDGPEAEDERDYNPIDDLVHQQAPGFTFDKRIGRSEGEDSVDERDYEEPEARKVTMPTARSVDFSSAPEREEDTNDGGLAGPGTRDEKEAAADRDFYATPGALNLEKNIVEFDRQVTREDLEQDLEVLDLVYNTDDEAVRPRMVGRVDMDSQVGRESLDGDEAELLCNPYVDEDYEPDLGPTRPSLRGFRMERRPGRMPRAPLPPWKDKDRAIVERALHPGETGLAFAPTSQSADLGAGAYGGAGGPNEDEKGEFRGLSQRASAPVLSFTKARVGDRLKKIEKTGPPLLPRDSMEDYSAAEERPVVAKSADELGPLRPRSILKVRSSIEGGGGAPAQSAEDAIGSEAGAGGSAGRGRRSLQVEFVGLTQSMPAEAAAEVMEEMQRTRAMAARLRQRMADRNSRRGVTFADSEPEPEPARAVVAKKVAKKKVRFADEPVGAPVTRLHISAPHKITPKSTPATRDKGNGKSKSKSQSESKSGGGARIIERVETFEQDPAERDRSFVAGPHIGHGRRELRRRLELEKAEAEAAAAAAGAAAGVSAAATVSDGDDVATRAEEPEPQPEPEPQTQPEEEEPVAADEEQAADEEDLGPDGGGYE